MSMTELKRRRQSARDARAETGEDRERRAAPIVPGGSIAGNALVAVIAIMAFLAAATVGSVDLVRSAAEGWQAAIGREVTIQVKPVAGRDLEQAVRRTVEIAGTTPGIGSVRAMSTQEIQRLLEPWLGAGFSMNDLPTPRLVLLRMADGANPDLGALSATLSREVPGASLDDHRVWLDRLRAIGGTFVGAGFAVLGLVVAATALSVLFATRGSMAGNRDIIEVLHVVGARDSFVARAFAGRFLVLGLKGGLIGGGVACLMFIILDFMTRGGSDGVELMFGHLSVSLLGYLGALAVVAAIAGLTALTSRMAVHAHLRRLD